MIRIVIENLLLFFLPTLAYVIYVSVTRREDAAGKRVLDDAPLLWLLIAGAALVVATLVIFGNTSGGQPGQTYHPPVIKDGRIQPGHID